MTSTIPDLDSLTPPVSESQGQKPTSEGNNPGFDIFKFIKSQLTQPTHFRGLFRDYTDTLSERKILYWIIYAVCITFDLTYYIFIHFLMLVTLSILVYGFAKAVGFTDWISNITHPVLANTQQQQVITPDLVNTIQYVNQSIKEQQSTEKADYLQLQTEIKKLTPRNQETSTSSAGR